MMGAAARFHRNDTGWKLDTERDHSISPHVAPDQDFSIQIKADDAAAIFAKVDSKHRDVHRYSPPESCHSSSCRCGGAGHP